MTPTAWPEWQPIETIPQDGRPVLISDDGGGMVVGWWGLGRVETDYGNRKSAFNYVPKYWTDLPPPQTEQDGR